MTYETTEAFVLFLEKIVQCCETIKKNIAYDLNYVKYFNAISEQLIGESFDPNKIDPCIYLFFKNC